MQPATRNCPSCNRAIAVPATAIGKKVRCSGCQAVFRIEEDGMSPASVSMEAPLPTNVPVPPPPKPAPAGAFAFGDDSSASEPTSNLDFSEQESRLNAGVRLRVNRLSNLLSLGGALTVCLAFYAVVRGFVIAGFTGSIMPFFGSIVTATFLATFGVLIIIGAGSLSRFRSKGFGMTAAILAILVGLLGFLGLGASVLGMTQGGIGALFACFLGGLCLFQVPSSLWGGIGTLLIINGDEINQAFQLERERQLRVSQQSGEFVPEKATASSCFHAACWFGLLGFVQFLLIGLFLAVLWRSSTTRQVQSETMIAVIVACALCAFFAIGLVLSAITLFVRVMPVFGYVGSVLCIAVAMQGFCNGLMSIPPIIVVTDSVLRPMLIAIAVLFIASLALGVLGALAGFPASNLLVRYRAALARQEAARAQAE